MHSKHNMADLHDKDSSSQVFLLAVAALTLRLPDQKSEQTRSAFGMTSLQRGKQSFVPKNLLRYLLDAWFLTAVGILNLCHSQKKGDEHPAFQRTTWESDISGFVRSL